MIALGIVSLAWLCGNEVQAVSRKGVQALGLSSWNSTSVANFLSAVNESRVRQFEVAFAPELFNRGNPYGNAQNVVTQLHNNGVQVTLAITLVGKEDEDWIVSASGTVNNSVEWKRRLSVLNSFLNANLKQIETIKLIPKLEATFSDASTFDARCKDIAAQLQDSALQKTQFRGYGRKNATVKVTSNDHVARTITIQSEVHGRDSGGDAWSNDGFWVSNQWNGVSATNPQESSAVRGDCIPVGNDDGMQLSNWVNSSNHFGGAALLWRPAYNIWKPSVSQNKRIWLKSPGEPKQRVDALDAPHFDANEKTVLLRYLRGS